MSPWIPSRRGTALLLLAGLLGALPALADRPRALIQLDAATCLGGPECEFANAHLGEALMEQGISVDSWFGPLDADGLAGHDCLFDLRSSTPLSDDDRDMLRQFLGEGHGLYLGGENISFDARNQSLVDALNSWGAGVVLAWSARPAVLPSPALFPEDVNLRTLPRHPTVDWLRSCHPIDRIVYDGVGVGWYQLPGYGDVLTGFPGASPSTAWGFDRDGLEDLEEVPEGRVVSILDLNWLANSYRFGDNRWFAGSIGRWLCGGNDALATNATHCAPRTQGFWHRQCLGAEPGGPEVMVAEWGRLRVLVDALLRAAALPQLAGSVNPTCDALNADPPDDPCERALKQVAAALLNARFGLVSCDCAFDEDAVEGILTSEGGSGLPRNLDAHDLADFLLGLIREGRCAEAARIAAGLNEGSLYPGYEGEGDYRAVEGELTPPLRREAPGVRRWPAAPR